MLRKLASSDYCVQILSFHSYTPFMVLICTVKFCTNYMVVEFLFSLTSQPLLWKTWEVWSIEWKHLISPECNWFDTTK